LKAVRPARDAELLNKTAVLLAPPATFEYVNVQRVKEFGEPEVEVLRKVTMAAAAAPPTHVKVAPNKEREPPPAIRIAVAAVVLLI
jgi:hypothetical protein